MKHAIVLIALLGMSMAACSNRAVYENVQAHNRFECQKLPLSQQEECLQQADQSYEQYERERKELEED